MSLIGKSFLGGKLVTVELAVMEFPCRYSKRCFLHLQVRTLRARINTLRISSESHGYCSYALTFVVFYSSFILVVYLLIYWFLFYICFITYSRLSLSRSRRDPLKNFEISVLRHIRFAELRKIPTEQPNFTNEHVICSFS